MSQHEEDQDSLFGSPPPSPQPMRRALSPTLALPGSSHHGDGASASASAATLQNVGTIALPGSQPVSELPMNPLALSLSHGVVSRPPAPVSSRPHPQSSRVSPFPSTSATSSHVLQSKNAASSTPSSRRTNPQASTSARGKTTDSTPGPSATKSKKRSRVASQALSEPGTRTPTPEITFPDPSGPPPTHFLRNQENLLGKAGVVAGVKASRLVQRHARGKSASNPIVLDDDNEDEEDTPRIGVSRHHSVSASLARASADPSRLKPPSNQDIVQVLIGQKDIFAVLQNILKLLSDTSLPPKGPTGFERRDPSKPILKKRKLNRVPAGAVDWDVPFPFAQGEGPEKYRTTWKKERGKQLVVQLITMIKDAAKKAAVKNYVREQEDAAFGVEKEKKKNRSTTPASSVLPVDSPALASGLTPAAASSTASSIAAPDKQPSPVPIPTPTFQPEGLQTSTITQPVSASTSTSTAISTSAPASLSTSSPSATVFDDSLPPTPQDQALFDSWMSFMQSFPVSLESMSDFSSPISATTSNTSLSSPRGTPSIDDFDFSTFAGFDFGGLAGAGMEGQQTVVGVSGDTSQAVVPSTPSVQEEMDFLTMMTGVSSSSSSTHGVSATDAGHSTPLQLSDPPGIMDSIMALDPHFSTGGGLQGHHQGSQDEALDPALMELLMAAEGGMGVGTRMVSDSGSNPIAMDAMSVQHNLFNVEYQPSISVAPPAMSPMTSTSSYPVTPVSSTGVEWDEANLQPLDVFSMQFDMADEGSGMDVVQCLRADGKVEVQGQVIESGDSQRTCAVMRQEDVEMVDVVSSSSAPETRVDKGKGTAVDNVSNDLPEKGDKMQQTPSASDVLEIIRLTTAQTLDAAFGNTTPSTAHSRAQSPTSIAEMPRKERRDYVVKKAEERKKKLQEELDKVKMQLWQTTIEQAALIQLANAAPGVQGAEGGRGS